MHDSVTLLGVGEDYFYSSTRDVNVSQNLWANPAHHELEPGRVVKIIFFVVMGRNGLSSLAMRVRANFSL